MRILGPIVLAQAPLVASRQSDFGLCRAVRAQLLGHLHIGREGLFLEQRAHQFHRCSFIAPSLPTILLDASGRPGTRPDPSKTKSLIFGSFRTSLDVHKRRDGARKRGERSDNGYLFVDYEKLCLRMVTRETFERDAAAVNACAGR
jgi:hypothetical protein